MEYDPAVLTQNMIYEAAEITNQSTPLDQIKYIGLSDQYTDLSLLTKLINLRIANFRLCNIQYFPVELFQLTSLQVIDLSGNQISTLPDNEKFSSLINLRHLNLSDNKISNIDEIYKLDTLTNLKQLILTGNICLTIPNAFDLIIDLFPKLILLNDSIITSQHRAYLLNLSNFREDALIPVSKADDYIFIYVKFIHANNSETYLRRSAAEIFCLTKIIRKYSCADKIQSVYRGFIQRKKYYSLKQTTKYLHNFLKFWVQYRINAADKIRSNFLHFQLRQRIKRIVSARKIQSVWRGYKVRRLCLITIFEKDDKIVFYITSPHLRQLKNFLRKKDFPPPDKEEVSHFRKIRLIEPKKQRLPGSPIVFYSIDNSALIRPLKVKKPSKNSVWCNHDHAANLNETRVSKEGVNFSPHCPLSVITYKPYTKPIKPSKIHNYDNLICCTYKNSKLFESIILSLISEGPARLRLFPEKTVTTISSLLVIQSACRSFLVRVRIFRSLKKMALEKRAASCIKHFVHSTFFRRSIFHSLDVLHYFRSLSNSNVFYINKGKLDKICLAKVATKYQVKFGYLSDKSVIIEKGVMQLPMLFIPIGRPVFANMDVSSLFKLGVSSSKVTTSMFKEEKSLKMTKKWIKRNRIVRLTFANPDEARTRIALYAYLTRDFTGLMNEKQVVQFCAANSIRNTWIGFSTRKMITHLGAQAGKKLNLQCLIKHNISEKKRKRKRRTNSENDIEYYDDYEYDENEPNSKKKFNRNSIGDDENKLNFLRRKDMSPDDALTILRHDYKPWKDDFKNFKENSKIISKSSESDSKSSEPTKSMYEMGLVNNLENAFARTNPIDEEKPSSKVNSKSQKLRASLNSSALIPVLKKPLVSSLRFPKKPLQFQIEIETQTIYAPTLHKLPNNRNSYQFSLSKTANIKLNTSNATFQSRKKMGTSLPLPDLKHPNTPINNDSLSAVSSVNESDSKSEIIVRKKLKERKPLFEDTRPDTKKSSNQSEKKSHQILMQIAFTKLVRLKQIGIQIMEAVISDKNNEQNRSKASQTRTEIEALKTSVNTQKEKELQTSKKRNALEKWIIEDEKREIESKTIKNQNRKILSSKNQRQSRLQKMRDDKSFAQQFTSLSIKIGTGSEKVEKISVNKEKLIGIDSTKNFKNQSEKIKKRKIEEAKWSKVLNQHKDELSKSLHSQKVQQIGKIRLNDLKKKSKMAALKKINVNSCSPASGAASSSIMRDQIEMASCMISEYMGKNCGEVESRLLAQIVGNIVEL